MTYTRTLRGDLLAHGFDLPGTSSDFAYTLAYNDAGQLLHHEVSDPLLHWSPAGTGTVAYAANGLHQYTTIAAASLVHA